MYEEYAFSPENPDEMSTYDEPADTVSVMSYNDEEFNLNQYSPDE